MSRSLVLLAIACTVVAACSSGPVSGPTSPLKVPRLSRTRFLAFGDSFTAGEVTSPIGAAPSGIHKLVLVPAASYPSQLQSQLQAAYVMQGASIVVVNGGEPGERILDGTQRFPGVFDANHPEVVLLMEGANSLPLVGPDTSTDLLQIMAQTAKNGGARVLIGSMIPQVAGRPRATTPTFELLNYNTRMQAMAAREGLTFVDLYNPMLGEAATLIGNDGLHPTEAGYRRIAELFFAAIRRELEE
ncbi:MAG TPA: GDSL-type esterase/lipase family protein [Vicinamibacterales bacterium]